MLALKVLLCFLRKSELRDRLYEASYSSFLLCSFSVKFLLYYPLFLVPSSFAQHGQPVWEVANLPVFPSISFFPSFILSLAAFTNIHIKFSSVVLPTAQTFITYSQPTANHKFHCLCETRKQILAVSSSLHTYHFVKNTAFEFLIN